LISFAKIFVPDAWARRLHLLGEIAVLSGLIYALYLVYFQAFVAHAFCVLCLTTATLIATLFVIHLVLRIRGGFQPVAESVRGIELGYAGAALFGAVGLLVPLLFFVNRLGTRPLSDVASELDQIIGEALPLYIDHDKLMELRPCKFDSDTPKIEVDKIAGPNAPFIGKADGIPVVTFDDPNCSHCQANYPGFLKLAEKYKDRAKFYVLPRMVWQYSLLQVEALELAKRQGKYFEMWQLLFDHPHQQGMEFPDIEALFHDLSLPTDNLAARLAAVEPDVSAQQHRTLEAGVGSTPSIYIEGIKVYPYNKGPECIDTLIHQKIAPDQPAASAATSVK
jgi:protein-disulfide isomerase/uncharacterized membrane protein